MNQEKIEVKLNLSSHKGYIPNLISVRFTTNFSENNPHKSLCSDKPILDIETVNIPNNSKNFEHTKIGMVGVFYKHKILQIIKTIDISSDKFKETLIKELQQFPQPFYAWNSKFDSEVLKDFLGKDYEFKEIKPEGVNVTKAKATEILELNVYDPIKFSKDCIYEYFRYLYFLDIQYLTRIRLHNQACLIKEHYLLNEREKLTLICNKQQSLDKYK